MSNPTVTFGNDLDFWNSPGDDSWIRVTIGAGTSLARKHGPIQHWDLTNPSPKPGDTPPVNNLAGATTGSMAGSPAVSGTSKSSSGVAATSVQVALYNDNPPASLFPIPIANAKPATLQGSGAWTLASLDGVSCTTSSDLTAMGLNFLVIYETYGDGTLTATIYQFTGQGQN